MTAQEILALSTTKTEKIKRLLEIGLTRTETAQALGVGYGFVQNVYAKIYGTSRQNRRQDQNVYSLGGFRFTRKFGIEIEAYNIDRDQLSSRLEAEGISSNIAGRSARLSYWKLTNDGSINGARSTEIVSPPLQGFEGLEQLRKVCKVLKQTNAKINRSCGLHVHLDAGDMQLQHWKNLYKNYIEIETIIDTWMPSSRRANANQYCQSLRDRCTYTDIDRARNLQEIESVVTNRSRYFKMNTQAFWSHGTVEFRQHSGTVDFEKIGNWVYFLARLVDYSRVATIQTGSWDSLIEFVPEELLYYFQHRQQALAV